MMRFRTTLPVKCAAVLAGGLLLFCCYVVWTHHNPINSDSRHPDSNAIVVGEQIAFAQNGGGVSLMQAGDFNSTFHTKLNGKLCDAFPFRGRIAALTSPTMKRVQLYHDVTIDDCKSFTNWHDVTMRDCVFDIARHRIVSIGDDVRVNSRTDEASGSGSIRVWDFHGRPVCAPYHFLNIPVAIARDEYADNIVVATQGGYVHRFSLSDSGLRLLSHSRVTTKRIRSIRLSNSGQHCGVATEGGVAFVEFRHNGMESVLDLEGDYRNATTGAVCLWGEMGMCGAFGSTVWFIESDNGLAVKRTNVISKRINAMCWSENARQIVAIANDEGDANQDIYSFDPDSVVLQLSKMR